MYRLRVTLALKQSQGNVQTLNTVGTAAKTLQTAFEAAQTLHTAHTFTKLVVPFPAFITCSIASILFANVQSMVALEGRDTLP